MDSGSDQIQLAWALDREGRRVRVTELDPRHRQDRAPFRCIGCGEPLIPRLGRIRARHFAHQPGSRCPLTSPETALHLDVKERLLRLCEESFAGKQRVYLDARCPGCQRRTPLELSSLGDRASSEGPIGKLRADVLVSRGSRPSVALEVRVAHALTVEKEETLAQLGLMALEIDARSEWESESEGAIRVACARSVGVPRCGSCQTTARADAGREAGGEEAAIAELETYRARGLMGSRPGPLAKTVRPISAKELARLAARFRCVHCGRSSLANGERLIQHACPEKAPRTVAWRGYDGTLVELDWWRRR